MKLIATIPDEPGSMRGFLARCQESNIVLIQTFPEESARCGVCIEFEDSFDVGPLNTEGCIVRVVSEFPLPTPPPPRIKKDL